MKIWLDDIRPAPNGYVHCKSVNQAKKYILSYCPQVTNQDIFLDLDHDLGDYYKDGGDAVKLLDWLEEQNLVNARYFFHLHTANPVGAENMRLIIQKNNWREF